MASKNEQPEKPKRENPFKRLRTVYKTIKQIDPQIGLWMLLAFVAVLAVAPSSAWSWGTSSPRCSSRSPSPRWPR